MVCLCHQLPSLTGVSIFCPPVALFAPCSGLRVASPPWLCQGCILLGWSQGEAQLWQELLGFLSASLGLLLPLPCPGGGPSSCLCAQG